MQELHNNRTNKLTMNFFRLRKSLISTTKRVHFQKMKHEKFAI